MSELHLVVVTNLVAYRTIDEYGQIPLLVVECVVPTKGKVRQRRTDIGLVLFVLKNISLSYTFDKKLVGKIGLENVRATISATNLFTITGYDGYDPEVGASTTNANVFGLDNGRYPSPTSWTFGLNVSF